MFLSLADQIAILTENESGHQKRLAKNQNIRCNYAKNSPICSCMQDKKECVKLKLFHSLKKCDRKTETTVVMWNHGHKLRAVTPQKQQTVSYILSVLVSHQELH